MPAYTILTLLVVSAISVSEANFGFGFSGRTGPRCNDPQLQHGSHEPRAPLMDWTHKVFTKITFSCDEGYTLVGDKVVVCLLNRRWSGKASCEKKAAVAAQRSVCALPPIGKEMMSEPHKDSYEENESVDFACMEDRKMRGSRKVTCGADGKFHPNPPRCLPDIECSPPDAPENGQITPRNKSFSVGDVVTFKCNEKFVLVGEQNTTCEESGNFTMTDTKCEAEKMCDRPKLAYRMRLVNPKDEYAVGDVAYFRCGYGYKLIGPRTLECASYGWDMDPPRCRREYCVRPTDPLNGEIIGPVRIYYRFSQPIYFRCNEGYHLVGPKQCKCTSSGLFYPKIPHCEEDVITTRDPPRTAARYGSGRLSGSCRGLCDESRNNQRACQCDFECQQRRDCCHDYTTRCRY